MDKVGNMQDCTGNHRIELEHKRSNGSVRKARDEYVYAFDGHSTQPRKESVNLKIHKQKLHKLKHKEKETCRTEHVKNFGTISNELTYE